MESNTDKMIRLIKENPGLPVVPVVDGEIGGVCDERWEEMNKQRKVLITITYNELGIIIDTKAEELGQSAKPEQTNCEYCHEDLWRTEEIITWMPLPKPNNKEGDNAERKDS